MNPSRASVRPGGIVVLVLHFSFDGTIDAKCAAGVKLPPETFR